MLRHSWKKYGSTQSADLYCVTLYIVSMTLAPLNKAVKVNLTVKQKLENLISLKCCDFFVILCICVGVMPKLWLVLDAEKKGGCRLCQNVGSVRAEKQIEMKMQKEYASKAFTVFGVTWKKNCGFVLKEIFGNWHNSFYKRALKFSRKSKKCWRMCIWDHTLMKET